MRAADPPSRHGSLKRLWQIARTRTIDAEAICGSGTTQLRHYNQTQSSLFYPAIEGPSNDAPSNNHINVGSKLGSTSRQRNSLEGPERISIWFLSHSAMDV